MRPLRVTCGVTTSANLLIPKVNHRIRYPVPRQSHAIPGQPADIRAQTFAPLSVPICLFALTATRPPRHHLGTPADHLGTPCPAYAHLPPTTASQCATTAHARPATGTPTAPPIEAPHARARRSLRPSKIVAIGVLTAMRGLIESIPVASNTAAAEKAATDVRPMDRQHLELIPPALRTSPKGP